jgi:hypothetical protein
VPPLSRYTTRAAYASVGRNRICQMTHFYRIWITRVSAYSPDCLVLVFGAKCLQKGENFCRLLRRPLLSRLDLMQPAVPPASERSA